MKKCWAFYVKCQIQYDSLFASFFPRLLCAAPSECALESTGWLTTRKINTCSKRMKNTCTHFHSCDLCNRQDTCRKLRILFLCKIHRDDMGLDGNYTVKLKKENAKFCHLSIFSIDNLGYFMTWFVTNRSSTHENFTR